MTVVLIVGAGAIGGFLGAVLSRDASNKVALVARGPHLTAMRKSGLVVHLNSLSKSPERFVADKLALCGNLSEATAHGPYDLVFLCVKAHQLVDIARDLAWRACLKEDTLLVPLQNGIPWYMFLSRPPNDPLHGVRLKSVDPTGELEKAFETRRIVGCIAMPACTLTEPGHIDHEHGWNFPMPNTQAAKRVAGVLQRVGFKPQCFDNFEEELWVKSLGSAVFNPVSALTGAVLGEFALTSDTVALTYKVMDEVRSVARSVGAEIRISNERRLNGATKIGDHKTSMLQDVEGRRTALEIDALVASVVEIANLTKTPVPTLSVILTLVQMKQRSMAREAERRAGTSRL